MLLVGCDYTNEALHYLSNECANMFINLLSNCWRLQKLELNLSLLSACSVSLVPSFPANLTI